ncbi:MarR family winged helix-turn-helix transcriptional regulator [Symbioplanes lichenis]|uniref:MarR family winged helix-turn-helix transcriptional regulator n=1 Tax=Symbioplanes lichenis TaxID=1629072 RepID=UPI0027391073|nr:MarR family transcriptional regulator [Actinoplanes lichenis]
MAAHRELMDQARELTRAMRLLKSRLPLQLSAIPPGTLQVLWIIGPAAGCHLKDLAERCSLDPSTVSRSVAALVKAGLVARSADPDDGRASVLTLTPAGAQALDEISGWYDRQLAEALQDWTPEDMAVLTTLMRRLSTDLLSRHDQPLEAAR